MSGPVTMALGPFMFRAHGFGYTDVGRKLDTSWVEIETAGQMNALQWTGPKSDSVVISGVLFPIEFGGLTTLSGLQLAAKNGMALMLVSLGGQVFGRHAVQKIEDDRTVHNRLGVPGKVSYTIEARRLSAGSSSFSLLGLF